MLTAVRSNVISKNRGFRPLLAPKDIKHQQESQEQIHTIGVFYWTGEFRAKLGLRRHFPIAVDGEWGQFAGQAGSDAIRLAVGHHHWTSGRAVADRRPPCIVRDFSNC